MKYAAFVFLFLLACRSNPNSLPNLLNEQKLLKDSANHVNGRIYGYVSRGVYDSAKLQGQQLSAIQARLKKVQSLINNFPGAK